MNTTQHAAESGGVMVAKILPPATVSVATVFGMPVSELVLWATLIYTVLMGVHKLIVVYKELKGLKQSDG